MAKAQGVSPATVQRIWDAHGLKPHRVRALKISNDPRFTEQLHAHVLGGGQPPATVRRTR